MTSTCLVEEQWPSAHITLETLPPCEQPGLGSASREHSEGEGFRALEKWNAPQINIYRSISTFWSFLVMGANDAAYGVSSCNGIGYKKPNQRSVIN